MILYRIRKLNGKLLIHGRHIKIRRSDKYKRKYEAIEHFHRL